MLRAQEILTSSASPSTSVFFLTGAVVVQLMASCELGPPVAVGVTGAADVVGLQLAVGDDAGSATVLVQSQGPAWMIEGATLRRMAESRASMLVAIAGHLWRQSEERARYAEDLQRQSVTQRLASWIVKSQGRQPGIPLSLTHIHLAAMLGVRRASISTAAVELRDMGLLDYARGRISVLDQDGLEAMSRSYRKMGVA